MTTNNRRSSPVRQTKIVATVGPASDTEATLERLVRAGVDVFRLNFSHGTHQEHTEAVRLIRRIGAREERAVAVLQDLQGPRLRTGPLLDGGPAILVPGATLVLTADDVLGTSERISVNYPDLPRDVRSGDTLLIADGAFELRVEGKTATEVRTRVVRGGPLGERKGINAPGVRLSVTSPTEKDIDDLRLGVSLGVDYVAISFVRDAREVQATRDALERLGAGHTPIVAKLERAEAIVNLDDILDASDGVMVARGDLGVELGTEKVPMVQKAIIRKANQQRIPVITATQMLESMVASPTPTRAEASDVANAILDGTDAVMLSAETTIGRFPVEAVQTMDRIAREVESFGLRLDRHGAEVDRRHRNDHSLAHAAAALAAETGASALVVFTVDGHTARLLSMERPVSPIYAFTANRSVYRRLALWHGVVPLRGEFTDNTDALIAAMLKDLLRRGLIASGEDVVVTRLSAAEQRHLTNFITVRAVPHGA